jgi:hypothetical protein
VYFLNVSTSDQIHVQGLSVHISQILMFTQ